MSSRCARSAAANDQHVATPQLPRFLLDIEADNVDEEEAPAYQADSVHGLNSTMATENNTSTDGMLASSGVALQLSTTPILVHSDTNAENKESDFPPQHHLSDIMQAPVFAQVKAAQTGIQGNASSVYTFGRRLATCKFFRPTKGYGFLNDINPNELGSQDVMVHATELYGPRNARIQSLARGELVEYTLVWAQHRGFYAVSVTGPGAVPVIGDAACNNGSIAYGRIGGASATTARPPLSLSAEVAAQAPVLYAERRVPLSNTVARVVAPPRYDNTLTAQSRAETPLSPVAGSPLASPGLGLGTSPLPSPRLGQGWPTEFCPSANVLTATSNTSKSTVDELVEQNNQLMRRLAVLENRLCDSSIATHPVASVSSLIWTPPFPAPR